LPLKIEIFSMYREFESVWSCLALCLHIPPPLVLQASWVLHGKKRRGRRGRKRRKEKKKEEEEKRKEERGRRKYGGFIELAMIYFKIQFLQVGTINFARDVWLGMNKARNSLGRVGRFFKKVVKIMSNALFIGKLLFTKDNVVKKSDTSTNLEKFS